MLVLAPTGRDAALLCAALESAGVSCSVVADAAELCGELEAGAGALLVAEESLVGRAMSAFGELVSRQLQWSDLPVLVLTQQGADSPVLGVAMGTLGNVALVERPVRKAALLSTVRAALRARARQYEIRDFLAERERSERALREADRRKDEFLAVLAHELRNPLAPLRNSLHLLRLSEKDGTREVHELMERQVEHLVRLVDDLLEVSRITRGRIELRPERVLLADVLRNAIDTSRPLVEAGRHELEVRLPETPLALRADSVRLAQVFSNLLNNAARYTQERGRITVEARRDGDRAVVSVRDTGIGISPDFLPRVFDMFEQGDEAAGRRLGGLGIGLTLVQSLVRLHGGEVEAFSDGAGQGSEFVVRLPLAAARESAVASAPSDDGGDEAASLDVLVVDDNRDAADSLALVLRAYGADVRVAYDGPAALRLVDERSPELVLLDIGMPAMDGYEVARALRRRPGGDELTLVALTGWGQEEDRRRSQLAGIDRHLVKPVEPDELRTLIRSF